MPLLIQYGHKLYIGVQDTIITYHTQTGTYNIKKLPEVIVPPNLSRGQEEVLKEGNREIISMCASNTDEYLAASTQNKQVVIFNTKSFDVLNNFVLNRVASKIRFTPNNDLLIADKTGDAFLYKLNGADEPSLILGHLSMLLDVLVTNCQKFIITSDRDEKIRVSNYPNCYNIQSYCLGHGEFVTNVEIMDDYLISASGDGSVRFWNYKSGKQIGIINTNEFIKETDVVAKFCSKMDEDKVEVTVLPITNMYVFKGKYQTFLSVSLLNLNHLLIFEIKFTNGKPETSFIQNITFNSKLISFSLTDKLYILTNVDLVLYKLDNKKYVLVKDDSICKLYDENMDVFSTCSESDVSVLYKRKYDNVQEYLERKKLRLEMK